VQNRGWVYQIGIPRAETIHDSGIEVPVAMGAARGHVVVAARQGMKRRLLFELLIFYLTYATKKPFKGLFFLVHNSNYAPRAGRFLPPQAHGVALMPCPHAQQGIRADAESLFNPQAISGDRAAFSFRRSDKVGSDHGAPDG
jgi:hypothetical protein